MCRLALLIVLSSIALNALSTVVTPSHRKTLSFGPRLRHTKFVTTPWSPQPPLDDPHEVAFALASHLHPRAEYHLRDDSYTDTLSGISHIYLQQQINDLVVVNGRLNANIKDGVVLSYGDSSLHDIDITGNLAAVDVHAEFCDHLRRHILWPQSPHAQAPLGTPRLRYDELHGTVVRVHDDACRRIALAPTIPPSADVDARAAVLAFMVHATVQGDIAEVSPTFDKHFSQLTVLNNSGADGRSWSQTIHNVPDTTGPVEASLAYIQMPSKHRNSPQVHLVWKLLVHMDNNAYEAVVSTTFPPRIISVADWVSDYHSPHAQSCQPILDDSVGQHTYRVFPWGVNNPDNGPRSVINPTPDRIASPIGWHSIPDSHMPTKDSPPSHLERVLLRMNTTLGNNIFAQEWRNVEHGWWLMRTRPVSVTPWPALTFDDPYPQEPFTSVKPKEYLNASITQLWYIGNMVHDLFYRYGFDEVAGNFQQYNFGRGGKEHDAVIMYAQDYTGWNGGSFNTTRDGRNGVCKIYIWDSAHSRDGAFEADIVIHELAHGLSGRLVGGPAEVTCLATGEAGGLSEGWSDFIGLVVRVHDTYEDLGMGVWASEKAGGIRDHPYSLDRAVNPTTYRFLDDPLYAASVHRVGEVWASMLWGVLHRLIVAHGISTILFPPTDTSDKFYRQNMGERLVPRHGNTLALRIVIDSMKLLPCSPTFLDARNAILEADNYLTGGENMCAIWSGFADRGMGPNAHVRHSTSSHGMADSHYEDYDVPSICRIQ